MAHALNRPATLDDVLHAIERDTKFFEAIAKKRAAAAKPSATGTRPAASPANTALNVPRNISEAMAAGMTNERINAFVRSGSIDRPSVAIAMQDSRWRAGDWRAAQQRGLIW